MKLFNKTKILVGLIVMCVVAMTSNVAWAIVEANDNNDVKQEKHIVKLKKDKKNNKQNADTEAKTEYTNDVHSVFSLKDCVDIALKYNPSIRSYICNEQVYKSRIGQAWANFFPEISGGIDMARTRNHYSGGNYPIPSMTYNMGYFPTISAGMMLFDFGKTKASADYAKRMYESKKADTKENINDIIYSIKSAYFNILFAQAQVHVYEDTVKDYEMQLSQAEAFYQIGKKARIDVVTAEYNLGKAKLNLVSARNTLQVAQVQLSQIMGIPEYTNYELSDELTLNDYEESFENLIKTAYDVRPELISSQKTVEAAKMNLRSARRNFAPDLSAYGSYANGRGNQYNLSSAQIGLQLNYSGLNLMRIKKEVDEAKAAYNKSMADYDDEKNTVYLNVKKNYLDLQTAKESIIIAKLALDEAKEQYRQVTGRYKAGVSDAIELKDGENTYLNARLDFYNAMLNYNVTAASLEKEVGVPLVFSDKSIFE